MSTRLSFAAALGAVLLFAGCGKEEPAIEIIQPQATPGAVLPKHWSIPDFTLTERCGQPLRRADLDGKIWIVDFIYTTCPGPCPMLTSRLSDIQKAIGNDPDVRLVSISVDPESDTTKVLTEYAERYKAGPNWFFCTGSKEAIYALIKEGFKFPVADAPTSGGLITHTTRVVVVDKTGTVRSFHEGEKAESVAAVLSDILQLKQEK